MNRDLKLDGLKFIMIFLVVFGHLRFNDWGIGVGKMIYSFHMPVFIFLSGYFTNPDMSKEKQIKWLKQTLLIYIIAQLAHILLSLGLQYAITLKNNREFDISLLYGLLSWKSLIYPRYALWYLICLIYWRFAVWRVLKNINDIILLCISCLVALLSGIIPIDHNFSFQRAFSFFPFFVLGLIFRKRELMSKINHIHYIYALVVFVVGLVIVRKFPVYMPKEHYLTWRDPIYRAVQSTLAMLLTLSVIRITRWKFVENLAKFGTYTLWIYIGHTYLLIIGKKVFPFFGISFNLFSAVMVACIYCAFFIWMAKLYQAIHIHRNSLNSLKKQQSNLN